MKTEVENKVLDLLIAVSELTQTREFEIPEIKFNLKGRAAGMCYMVGNKCTLRFNPKLLEENKKNFLQFTVPHEVAHYITGILYDKVKPHGKEWQNIMRFFGIENPLRCHSYDLGNLRPWIYGCKCRNHSVTQKQHSAIIRGAKTYACKDCGGTLKFVKKRLDV